MSHSGEQLEVLVLSKTVVLPEDITLNTLNFNEDTAIIVNEKEDAGCSSTASTAKSSPSISCNTSMEDSLAHTKDF